MIIARHFIIRGHVQGVFYRGWAVETARALGLTGWVRNRSDGSVEAIVQGNQDAVGHFAQLARRGSPDARVETVEAGDAAIDDGLAAFTQASTV